MQILVKYGTQISDIYLKRLGGMFLKGMSKNDISSNISSYSSSEKLNSLQKLINSLIALIPWWFLNFLIAISAELLIL